LDYNKKINETYTAVKLQKIKIMRKKET